MRRLLWGMLFGLLAGVPAWAQAPPVLINGVAATVLTPVKVAADGAIQIDCESGCGGSALADDADFTDGTTSGQPVGGVAESAAPTTVTEGDFGWFAMTLNRAIKSSPYSPAGDSLANDTLDALKVTNSTAATATAYLTARLSNGTDFLTPATDATLGTTTYTEATSTGPIVAGVRNDTPDSLANTTNEAAPLGLNQNGALWTSTIDPCSYLAKSYYIVNTSSAATFEIANASGSNHWYVCSVNIVVGAAQGVAIAHDDTDGCGSITAGMNGGTTAATGWQFAANGGIALGNGDASVLKSATGGHYFCMLTSTTAQTSGVISYVSAP